MPGIVLFSELQRKTSAFFPANRKRKQRLLTDSGEAAGPWVFLCVLLLNQIQSLPQLEHGGKFVLAGVAAKAVAYQLGNRAVLFKFHSVSMAALDDGVAFYTVQAEIL